MMAEMNGKFEEIQFIATLEFNLRKMLSPELLELLDSLYWSEQIYETNVAFNADADFKYKLRVLSPNNLAKNVWEKINQKVLEDNARN